MKYILTLLACATCATSVSAANNAPLSPFYAGVNVGQLSFDIDNVKGKSYGILAGYQINPQFAVELNMNRAPAADYSISGLDYGSTNNIKHTSTGIYAIYHQDISSTPLYIKAKLGIAHTSETIHNIQSWSYPFDYGTGALSPDYNNSQTALAYGLGAGAQINPHIAAELMYTKLKLEDTKPSNLSLGLNYRF